MVVEVGDVLYSLSLIILGSVRVAMANGTYRQITDMLLYIAHMHQQVQSLLQLHEVHHSTGHTGS